MHKPRTNPSDTNSPHQKKGSEPFVLQKVRKILSTQSALIYDSHLSHDIEKALTIESADMVLLTLKRLDESILLAPHMIPSWKLLVERLALLSPELALKYTAEMSLYWDPYYADGVMADAGILGQASQQNYNHVIDFIRGTQLVGNELDLYGTGIWSRLILAKVSSEPIDDLLHSILHIFPGSIFGTGYCRTPFGVDFSIMQSHINPDFRKCAVEMYLSILAEFIPEHPEEGIYFISCVMNSLKGEDYSAIMEKFFECWKTCIHYIAQKDPKEAISYIESDTDFPLFGDRKEKTKSEFFSHASSIVAQPRIDKLPRNAFEVASDWCEAVMRHSADISKKEKNWEAVIMGQAKRNPEFAIQEIYSSIGPFKSQIIEKIGEKDLFEKITEIILKIVDTLAKTDILRALYLCVYMLREERYGFFYFSLEELSMRILEYIDQMGESNPDIALDGQVLIDKGIECSMHWGVPGVNYLSDIDERHKKIFDLIPQAAGINLLTSISACERLLLRTDKSSKIYAQTLTLWREYMRELKKRNAVMAAEHYSQLCATIKNREDDLFTECERGYQFDCLEDVQKQRRTVMPLEQSSQMIVTIDNPEI